MRANIGANTGKMKSTTLLPYPFGCPFELKWVGICPGSKALYFSAIIHIAKSKTTSTENIKTSRRVPKNLFIVYRVYSASSLEKLNGTCFAICFSTKS
jgi:hypothetical protein